MIGLILFFKLFLCPNLHKFDQYLSWDICNLNSLSFPLPSPKLISVSTCHKKAGIFSYSFLQTFGTEERRGLCVTLGHCINLGGKQVL